MRWQERQLGTLSEATLQSSFTLFGQESFLIQESAQQLKTKLLEMGYDPCPAIHLKSANQAIWDEVKNALCSPSLFCPKTQLSLHIECAGIGTKGQKALQEILATLDAKSAILIVICHQFSMAQLNSAWLKALDKNGVSIQHWPVQEGQLLAWITERAKAKGLALSREWIEQIAISSQGNVMNAANEIEIACLLNSSDVKAQVQQSSQYTIFQLQDAILEGAAEKSQRIYQRLLAQYQELPLLLWALAKICRECIELHPTPLEEQLNKVASLKIPKRRQPLYLNAVKREISIWENGLIQLATIDKYLKSGQNLHVKQMLSSLIIELANGECVVEYKPVGIL